MNNILINKNQLDEYLLDFHESKKEEILNLFKDFNFDIGKFSFRDKMKRIISMPKFGKRTLIYWISRGWSEEESLIKRTKDNKNPESSPMNINFWIKKGLNKKEAEFKIKSQRKFNKEYWTSRGYSEEESNKKTSEFQKKSNNSYIEKLKTDSEFKESICIKRGNNINYWINKGFSIEDSKKLQSDYQRTFTLEKCIQKYGEELGKEKWNKRQEKWQKSLNSNGNLKIGWSKISQLLFNNILQDLDDDRKEFILYGIKNKEFILNDGIRSYLYDFTDLKKKKIIEFNGDIYHGNPILYKDNDKPNPFKDLTCSELWKRDKEKIELAEKNGFDVLTIWESEYKKNKEEITKKCLEFLK